MKPRLLLLCALLAGCAGDETSELFRGRPGILALSTYQASVGDEIRIVGMGFSNGPNVVINLRWTGRYTAAGGAQFPVDVLMYANFVDQNSIKIPFLGPFRIPFSATGDQLGVFEGNITPTITGDNRPPVEGVPFPVRFDILPSIVIGDLQPAGASCANPAKRLLGGFGYRIKVKAVGFRAINFTYQLIGQPLTGDRLMVRHLASSNTDSMGDNLVFVPDPVPDGSLRYTSTLVVSAFDDTGLIHKVSLPFTVHRPLEFIYSGQADIAQIYTPTAMTGCLTGSTAGTTYAYQEGQQETRSRTLALAYDQSWSQATQNGTQRSSTDTNGVRFNQTDKQDARWETNSGQEVAPKVQIGFLYQAGVEYRDKMGESMQMGTGSETSVGQDHSTSDTVSQSESTTLGYALHTGRGDFFSIASTDYNLNSFSTLIFAGMYAVAYRQTTRLQRPATLVAYNLCGEPTVAGQATMTDWLWSVDIAQSPQCPPFPEPNLPQPVCKIGPCE